MSQIKQRNWIYKCYEKEILYLQRRGNTLLQAINQQETRMNQAKQQNLQPNKNELYTLEHNIKMLLRMLALINTYQYFQSKNEPLTIANYVWLNEICDNCYLNLLERFCLKLKLKLKNV